MNTRNRISKLNVLAVDDAPVNLDLLRTVLTEEGYNVRCAINGSMALKVALTGWANLILLDIRMPEMDGYEICQILKTSETTREIPVIFLSALNETFDKGKAFEVGGVDYITKPFEVEEVLIRVKNQLKIQSLTQEILDINKKLEEKVLQRTCELETANQQLKQEIKQRRIAQDRLLQQSLTDPLTSLANQNSFIGRLKRVITLAETNTNADFVLFLLYFNHFQEIEPTLNRFQRKQLLIAIGSRLASCLPTTNALIGRLEGDEFGILLENVKDIKVATDLVQKIQQKLAMPLPLERGDIFVTACIGIVTSGRDYQDADGILQDAEIAMQQAKERHKDSERVFAGNYVLNFKNSTVVFSKIESVLKRAIKEQQFVVYYQPIIELNSQKILEIETLLCWYDLDYSSKLPIDFIAIAEKTDLILALDDIVMKTACQQVATLIQQDEKLKNLRLCINLSTKHFFRPDLIEKTEKIIEQTKLLGQHLTVKISESTIANNFKLGLEVIEKLKQRGIKLCIDNFSFEDSCLTYLPHFDRVQINPASLKNISSNSTIAKRSMALNITPIEYIVSTARKMNITVIAKNIETSQQLEYFKSLKCEYVRGSIVSQPMTYKDLENFLIWIA